MTNTVTFASRKVCPGDGSAFSGYVTVRDGKIVSVSTEKPESDRIYDVGDLPIIPGLVDIHIHGSNGFDVASDDPEAIENMANYLATTGTTSFLPTLGAAPQEVIERTIERVRDLALGKSKGARVVGLHLEGPFLNPVRKGAMRPELFMKPRVDLAERWMELSRGTLKRITMAPEMEGAYEVVSTFASNGVLVAAGHTDATYEEATRSFIAGVRLANHMYNAMRPFNHREPGIMGAALADGRVSAEVICDGIHVHPAAVNTLVRAKGIDRVILITDAIMAAGLKPGFYKFLGHEVTIDETGKSHLADGTIAGSTATLTACLKNMVEWTGIPLEKALCMATANPARAAGVFHKKGSLFPGKDADIVVLGEGYKPVYVMVEGNLLVTPDAAR